MREVYDLGPALAVACVSQDGRKDFQFARVQKLGVGVCTLQDKYGRMVPNVDRAPVEWWKTHYLEGGNPTKNSCHHVRHGIPKEFLSVFLFRGIPV